MRPNPALFVETVGSRNAVHCVLCHKGSCSWDKIPCRGVGHNTMCCIMLLHIAGIMCTATICQLVLAVMAIYVFIGLGEPDDIGWDFQNPNYSKLLTLNSHQHGLNCALLELAVLIEHYLHIL